jgi:hypothetical protein
VERITVREIILEETLSLNTGNMRDYVSTLENRIHNYILAFTELHKRLAVGNQDFHTAREIQKLENRLLLSSTVQEESA